MTTVLGGSDLNADAIDGHISLASPSSSTLTRLCYKSLQRVAALTRCLPHTTRSRGGRPSR